MIFEFCSNKIIFQNCCFSRHLKVINYTFIWSTRHKFIHGPFFDNLFDFFYVSKFEIAPNYHPPYVTPFFSLENFLVALENDWVVLVYVSVEDNLPLFFLLLLCLKRNMPITRMHLLIWSSWSYFLLSTCLSIIIQFY